MQAEFPWNPGRGLEYIGSAGGELTGKLRPLADFFCSTICVAVPQPPRHTRMNAKMFLRAFVFLVLLFVVLYIGMTNRHNVDFYFPILLEKKVTQPAAVLFFAMFATGVIAGMMLQGGGSSGGGRGEGSSKRK
jgi:uncharacterized integral membrane protein